MALKLTWTSQVEATDRDTGNFGQVLYELSSPSSLFMLNSSTGELSTAPDADIQYKLQNEYVLTIKAHDGKSAEKTEE